MKKVAPSLIICLLLLAGASGCGSKPDQAVGAAGAQPAPPPEYSVLTLAAQNAEFYTDFPTILEGQANVEIRPKTDGFIDQVLVDEGAHVRKGQLLFRLNSDEADQQVRSAQEAIFTAQANLSAAQMDVDKTRPLVQQEILSQYQLDAYRYTLQARRAALAQAKSALLSAQKTQSYTHITSPVDGVTGTIPYKLGALVNSAITPALTTVSSIGQVRAYFSVNEKDALAFAQQNQPRQRPSVQLVLSDGTVYRHAGRVETASGLINTRTGSLTVRASFPNPEGILRSGATGLVRVPQQAPGALVIPQAATYELQGKHFAYVVGAGSKVKNTEIEVQPLPDGLRYVVRQGLKAGDQIVMEGVSNLQDGQVIKPRATTAAAPAAPTTAPATAAR